MFSDYNTANADFTILFVDDELDINNSMISLLKYEGYKVVSCDNGKDAIEIIRKSKIDILVLDYFMPGFNGNMVVDEVRKFNKEIFILLQTGYSGQEPPLETMKTLNIQGYHDKADGPEKLLLWIAAGVNVCNQIRLNKQLCKENELAEKTLESVNKDKSLLLEHTKNNSINSLSKSILDKVTSVAEDISISLKDISGKLDNSIKLIDTDSDKEVTMNALRKIYKEINILRNNIQTCYKDLVSQEKESLKSMAVESFTLEEFINKFETLVNRDVLLKFDTVLNQKYNIGDMAPNMCISGDIGYFINILYKIIVKSSLLSQKVENGKHSEINYEIYHKDTFLGFKVVYKGSSTIEQMLLDERMVIDKKTNATKNIIDIVSDFFNGNIYFEEKGEKKCTNLIVPIILNN